MKIIQLKFYAFALLISMLLAAPFAGDAQEVDDSGTFDPVTGTAVIYASLTFVDVDEDGAHDAAFALSEGELTTYGDYSTALAFYGELEARNGGGMTNNDPGNAYGNTVNDITTVSGTRYHTWYEIDVPNLTCSYWVQPAGESEAVLLFEHAAFRKTDITQIQRWSAFHNPSAEPDVVEVGTVDIVGSVGEIPAALSDATLSALSIDIGSLEPAFDPAITNYTATIPSGISGIEVTANTTSRGASVSGDGLADVSSGSGTITVTVTSEDGSAEKKYTIDYTVADEESNATLSALTFSTGTLTPAFSPDVFTYNLSVSPGTASVDVSATAAAEGAAVSGDGTIDLTVTEEIIIEVTAPDGVTQLSYTIGVSSLALKHSYTFDDGTARDKVGAAHGTLFGGTIEGGRYVSSANGHYLELPAADMAINTYSELTLEAYVIAGTANATHTMLSYFGNTEGAYGVNYVFQALANGGASKTAISCLNLSAPWNAETSVTGELLEDGGSHHLVTTLNDTEIAWYVDGVLVGTALLSPDNKVANLGAELAYLCKGGYTSDPTWIGSIDEFNIYEGVMDAGTISKSASDYLSDATLSSITLGKGVLDPVFDPDTMTYSVTVPSGTTTVNVTAVPNSPNATVTGDGEVDISSPTVIEVTAVNGKTILSYTINWVVKEAAKDATLSELIPDAGTLAPAFNPAVTDYSLSLPYGTETVTFTATSSAEGATISGNDPLDVSAGSGTYEVTVTSQDESESVTYSVEATVDAFTLTAFTVGGVEFDGDVVTGTVNQPIDPSMTDYSVTLPAGTVEAFISSVTTNDPNAFIELPDTVDISGGSVTVPLRITSENLETSILYHITFNQAGVYNTSTGLFEPALTETNHVIYTRLDITNNGVAIDGLFALSNGEVQTWEQTSGGIRFTQSDGIVQLRDGGAYVPAAGTEGALPVLYDTTYHCWVEISPADTMYSVYVQMEGMSDPVVIGEDARFRFLTNMIDRWVALSATGSNQGLNVRRVDLVANVGDFPALGTDATLAGIELETGNLSPDFDPAVTAYAVSVPFGTDSLMVSAMSADRWAMVEGEGYVRIDSGSGTANLLVKAEDTTVTKTYTIDFTELAESADATLADLTVDIDGLTPAFHPGVTDYEVTVPFGTSVVNITTETNVASASVSGDGAIDVSAGGTIPVAVVVTAGDGTTTKTYTVSITVEGASTDATLAFLRADAGTLEPAFSPEVNAYGLEVPFGTETVKVTYKPTDINAAVSITSGGIIPVTLGEVSAVEIIVTAEDGSTTNTYTIDVTMTDPSSDATLAALAVDAGTLTPTFDAAVFTYTVDVPYGTETVIVSATSNHPGATISGNGPIDVSSGSATATIVVTAEDMSTETYTIEMTVLEASTDATLADLSVDGGILEPAFDPEVFEYMAVVPLGTTTATVSAVLNDERAAMTGAGALDVISGSGVANVVVTAEDGTTTNTYKVTVYVGSKPEEPLNVEDQLAERIRVYPNPAGQHLTIDLDARWVSPTFTVLDVQGKHYAADINIVERSVRIDVGHLSKGLYFIRIGDADRSAVKRFIKD